MVIQRRRVRDNDHAVIRLVQGRGKWEEGLGPEAYAGFPGHFRNLLVVSMIVNVAFLEKPVAVVCEHSDKAVILIAQIAVNN
jgi:hypothetical protein